MPGWRAGRKGRAPELQLLEKPLCLGMEEELCLGCQGCGQHFRRLHAAWAGRSSKLLAAFLSELSQPLLPGALAQSKSQLSQIRLGSVFLVKESW